MLKHTVLAFGLLVTPVAAFAQNSNTNSGAAAGAATGAVGGAIVGGPVGAVVGGAAGAIAGGAVGSLTADDRVYVERYVTSNRRPSVTIDGSVAVGAVLPERVEIYEVRDRPYRYAYVNGNAVIIEPSSRRVIHVID